MKKWLALFLCLTMLFSLCPAAAFAEEEGEPDAEPKTVTYTFTVNGEVYGEPQTVADGGTLIKPEDPALDGSDFVGWFAGEAQLFASGDTETVTVTEDSADVTVTARFNEQTPSATLPVPVVFYCTPETATVTVYDPANTDENGDATVVEPVNGVYRLTPGSYLYDVRCEGYTPVEGAALNVQPLTTQTQQSVSVTLSAADEGDEEPAGGDTDGDDWFVDVNYGGTDYEIEFVFEEEPDVYSPFAPLPLEYAPSETEDLLVSFYLKVVQPNGELAPDEVQALITGVTVNISETNADESDPTPYVSWNDSAASGSLLLHPGSAFSAELTAAFTFDGAPCSVATSISYYEGEEPVGNDDEWYVAVSYEDASYEIEFLSNWGYAYGPFQSGGTDYMADDMNDFVLTLPLAVVTREDPDNPDGVRIPADDTLQALITDVALSFALDEGGTEPNYGWDEQSRKVTVSAACYEDFSGALTASFLFNGEPYSIRVHVEYMLLSAYLAFLPEGETAAREYLTIRPSEPLSGHFVLCQWDGERGVYADTILTDADAFSFDSDDPVVDLTWDQDGLATLTPTAEAGWFGIFYRSGDESFQMNGDISGSLRLGDGSYGDNYRLNENKPYHSSFVLGGLRFYQDQEKETYATRDFFDRIVSCQVDLTLLTGTMPSVSEPVKIPYPELDNAELYTFEITSEPDTPFNVSMTVTFSYKEDGWQEGDELSVYTVKANVFYQQTTDVSVDASDLDTVAALNEVLASKAALGRYLESKGVDFIWQGTLRLDLPAVDYSDGVIICKCEGSGFYGVELHGSNDGEGTVFRALEARSGLNFVNNIHFIASPDVLQSYGGSEISCGVLALGSGEASASSIYGVDDCFFSGYTYAIRSTTGGYAGSVMGCTLSDCDYGVYIDSSFNAAGNSENSWNTYIRCGDAICINELPSSITSYMYRIHDNMFVDCGRDLNISDAGVFFCYGNFFTLDRENRRTARLSAGENTTIIANPCRSSSSWTDDSMYWIDPELPTEILNSEASSMRIDAAAFSGDSIKIDVVNMEDGALDTVGTWTFGGEGA